jgi:hypothetical protein
LETAGELVEIKISAPLAIAGIDLPRRMHAKAFGGATDKAEPAMPDH